MSSPHRVRDKDGGWVGLLTQVLYQRPNLPMALCVGKHSIFDAALHPEQGGQAKEDTAAYEAAASVCGQCTASACSDRLRDNQSTGRAA